MAEALHPNGGAEDHQTDRSQQAQPAADHPAPGGQLRPVPRQQNNREVTAGGDGEGQADHESNILIFKQNTQQNGHHPKDQHGDLGDLQLLTLGRALAEDVGVQVVRHR
ncbi:hypothetical protein BGU35_19160 [Clostridioides difficile]|nr:hypothetical protein BGU35_19160 [Clostridioides difficile]